MSLFQKNCSLCQLVLFSRCINNNFIDHEVHNQTHEERIFTHDRAAQRWSEIWIPVENRILISKDYFFSSVFRYSPNYRLKLNMILKKLSHNLLFYQSEDGIESQKSKSTSSNNTVHRNNLLWELFNGWISLGNRDFFNFTKKKNQETYWNILFHVHN